MVSGKRLARGSLLPSLLEDGDEETGWERGELGGVGERPPSRAPELLSRDGVDDQVGLTIIICWLHICFEQ